MYMGNNKEECYDYRNWIKYIVYYDCLNLGKEENYIRKMLQCQYIGFVKINIHVYCVFVTNAN